MNVTDVPMENVVHVSVSVGLHIRKILCRFEN